MNAHSLMGLHSLELRLFEIGRNPEIVYRHDHHQLLAR